MFTHAPKDYICPICLGVQKIESDQTLIWTTDIVYQDTDVTAFISSFFIGNNKGHVIVVPNEHFENVYDMPEELLSKVHHITKKLAIVVKNVYECEGITFLQNNEPVGNQHAFHYHLHLFPRYKNDDLHAHMMEKTATTREERLPYAEKLREYLTHGDSETSSE